MNIKDIAELAKVSPTTVSRYFNGTNMLCDQTRERIRKVVDLTGYNPKLKSHRVDINHNPTIGILIPSLLNPVFAEIVSGIQERARHFNYSTIIIDTEYQPERERQAVIDLIRQRVSGVILTVASTKNNEALSLLKEFNFPLSLVHNQAPGNDAAVFVNNFQAGYDVADYLLKTGHQKLGMVAGQFNRSDRAKLRYEGFKTRISQAPNAQLTTLLEVDPSVLDPFTDLNVHPHQNTPTAWFCSNDLLALKLINHFHHLDISVPGKVSVVGFDGMSLGQITYPSLATVKVPHQRMGNLAVDLLLNSKYETPLTLQKELNYQLSLSGTVAPV